MPDPAFRSYWQSAGFSGGATATEPAGATSGDVLYALVGLTSQGAPDAPSGWTQDGTVGAGPSWTLFRALRGGSAPSLTWSFSNDGWIIHIVCISDPDQTTQNDATPVSANGTGVTITWGDITTVTANALHVVVGAQFSAGAFLVWSPTPSGMTTRTVTSGASSEKSILADATKATPGATGTKTATTNASSDAWGGFTIAVRPATATTKAPPPSLFRSPMRIFTRRMAA